MLFKLIFVYHWNIKSTNREERELWSYTCKIYTLIVPGTIPSDKWVLAIGVRTVCIAKLITFNSQLIDVHVIYAVSLNEFTLKWNENCGTSLIYFFFFLQKY